MYHHWHGTPLHSPYFRAVQVGKAIHFLLRADIKVYEQDNGRGQIRHSVWKYKQGLTSRYCCQRLQQLTESIYRDFMREHGRAIASLVLTKRVTKSTIL